MQCQNVTSILGIRLSAAGFVVVCQFVTVIAVSMEKNDLYNIKSYIFDHRFPFGVVLLQLVLQK